MKIMVIGSGGREHAIIKKLKESRRVGEIYALPGNGGIARDAVCVDIDAKDIDAQVRFAVENGIDFAVVAPDDPLVLGAVDRLNDAGIPCFGPNKAAAAIEGSKVFAKSLMKKYGIPTAAYEVFDDPAEAVAYLEGAKYPAVIKADGLALGKGVIIAESFEEAKAAVRSVMEEKRFGESGSKIVIEEFLRGPEVSVLAFTDGKTVVPMVSSMDHKRALDGDLGPNTGGMGTVAPNPYYTKSIADECMNSIFMPTVRAMCAEGRPFRGCLYFGLMLTENGPRVIEYNCRFGDPEAQVVLPLLDCDLLEVMIAVSEGRLADADVRIRDGCAACVIVASGGYPGKYQTGYEISVPEDAADSIIYAGVRASGDKIFTSGGRVLGVTATAKTLKEALDEAYVKAAKVKFENAFYRRDIGKKALCAAEAK